MMNPVVIFLDIDREIRQGASTWKYRGPISLPYGWDLEGKGHPYGEGIAFQLLLLDDKAKDVRAPVHANADATAPLPVVRHATSIHHSPQVLGAQLKGWGTYIPVGVFSHDFGSDKFVKIVDLIEGRLKPETLAKQFSIAAQIAHFIELAATCQIKLLDATADLDKQLKPLLRDLPEDFAATFRAKACGRDGLERPDEGLREISNYVQTLRS